MEMAAGITRTTARRQGQSRNHVQTATGMQGDPHPPNPGDHRQAIVHGKGDPMPRPGQDAPRCPPRHELIRRRMPRPGGWTAHRAIVRFRRRHPCNQAGRPPRHPAGGGEGEEKHPAPATHAPGQAAGGEPGREAVNYPAAGRGCAVIALRF